MYVFYIPLSILLSIACKSIDKSEAVAMGISYSNTCSQFCQQSEGDFLGVLTDSSGVVMSSEEYQQLCSTAPETSDCLDCWQWLGTEMFLPNSLSPECASIDMATIDASEIEQQEILENCIQTCNDDALDPFQFEEALNEFESADSGLDDAL